MTKHSKVNPRLTITLLVPHEIDNKRTLYKTLTINNINNY